jgi:hypothetical protein
MRRAGQIGDHGGETGVGIGLAQHPLRRVVEQRMHRDVQVCGIVGHETAQASQLPEARGTRGAPPEQRLVAAAVHQLPQPEVAVDQGLIVDPRAAERPGSIAHEQIDHAALHGIALELIQRLDQRVGRSAMPPASVGHQKEDLLGHRSTCWSRL